MKGIIGAVLKERVVATYGHVRACTDEFIEFRGTRIENHFRNRHALARLLGAHLTEVERFLCMNNKDPEGSPYFRKIRELCGQAERREIIEIPDLPTSEELLIEQ